MYKNNTKNKDIVYKNKYFSVINILIITFSLIAILSWNSLFILLMTSIVITNILTRVFVKEPSYWHYIVWSLIGAFWIIFTLAFFPFSLFMIIYLLFLFYGKK